MRLPNYYELIFWTNDLKRSLSQAIFSTKNLLKKCLKSKEQ